MERASGSGGGSSDFVKKLYKMLEDPTYRHIVRWNDMGDSFIVLDNTEFTKNVLPRHFKHSNFASFVRQLNKYDFHKIRNTDEPGGSQYGEQAWEFKHPNFQMHNRDQLENIRRKAPAARKPAQKAASEDPSALQAAFSQITELQNQLQRLKDSQKGIDHQLERNDTMCQALVAQVGNMHKKLMDYEDLVQRLVVQLAQKELQLRARGLGTRNSNVAGVQDMEGNEYFERAVASLKSDGGGVQNAQLSGVNNVDEEAVVEDGDDVDVYEEMDDEMDEDMDGNEGEDGSANDEDYMPTSTTIPSQGLTPFIMENSTPLGQNYDQGERDANASVPTRLDMDEILESRNWPIGPFDPGGVTGGHILDEQNSRSMFDILLSKSTKETQSWLKLPNPKTQSQVRSTDGPTPSGGASPHSSATTSSGNVDDPKNVNGVTEVPTGRKSENDSDSTQVSVSRPALSTTPQISVTYDKEEGMRDGVITQGRTGFYLPPITEVGSLSSAPGLLSQLKQTLDAANIDKGKGKEASTATLERRPPDSRYYTAPILVVDDDPMCRRLLMLFFSYNKQEVDCAGDGVSAVEKVNRHKYSIIFMDVILPLLDGVSATKLMRKTDKDTPIVCLASTTNEVDLERYKRSGMNLVLSKPFGFKKLYETMMTIMPESMGWVIPRGLRPKRNKGTKEQRAPINDLSDGNSRTIQQVICGPAGAGHGLRDVRGEITTDSPMTDAGRPCSSEENAGTQVSAPHGPFCLRPMSIANLINEKNYDPKKREHMDTEQQKEIESEQGADHKKRRLDISPKGSTAEVTSALNFESSSSRIDTQQPASDYDMSLPLETSSSIPVTMERVAQQLSDENHAQQEADTKVQFDTNILAVVAQQDPPPHQAILSQSMIASPPTQGSFSFALEAPSLQDAFILSRTPSATAIYPMESDYIPAKMDAQDDSSLRLDTYPVHYQSSENEGLPITMSRGAQGYIPSGAAVGVGPAMNTSESANPARFSYDEYRVD